MNMKYILWFCSPYRKSICWSIAGKKLVTIPSVLPNIVLSGTIEPSTALTFISVHSEWQQTELGRYFWSFVLEFLPFNTDSCMSVYNSDSLSIYMVILLPTLTQSYVVAVVQQCFGIICCSTLFPPIPSHLLDECIFVFVDLFF